MSSEGRGLRQWRLAFVCLGPPFALAMVIGHLSSWGFQGDPVAYLDEQALHGAGAGAVLGIGFGTYRSLLRRDGIWLSVLFLIVMTPLVSGLGFAAGVAVENVISPWNTLSLSDVLGMWLFAAVVGAVPGWLALLVTSVVVARR